MKVQLTNVIVILIGAILVVVVLVIQPPPLPTPQEEVKACSADSECAKVQTTCCPCSMGGEEVCVPALNASLYQPKDCTDDIICIALYNCKIETCRCQDGNCEAVFQEVPRFA